MNTPNFWAVISDTTNRPAPYHTHLYHLHHGLLEVKNSGFMSELLWVLVSSFLMGWLISKTKQEENFYKKGSLIYS